jgi:hypothetical protein
MDINELYRNEQRKPPAYRAPLPKKRQRTSQHGRSSKPKIFDPCELFWASLSGELVEPLIYCLNRIFSNRSIIEQKEKEQ